MFDNKLKLASYRSGRSPVRGGVKWLSSPLHPSRVASKPGQDLVEFAIIVPILILLLVGLIELGRIFYTLVIINNAVREGARYGIIYGLNLPDPNNPPSGCSINNPCDYLVIEKTEIQAVVRKEATERGVDLTGATIYIACITPVGAADTSKCKSPAIDSNVTPPNHDQLEVKVTYPYSLLTKIIFSNETLNLVRSARMRVP